MLLLVNPDIILEDPTTIQKLRSIMDSSPEIGVLACTQINDDGSPVEIARNFPNILRLVLRRFAPRRLSELHLLRPLVSDTREIEVDWVQSSFVLISNDLWNSIQGLNEKYYIFMSDVELCLEAWRRGFKVVVTSIVYVRADGLRASRGGMLSILKNKALRIHIRDAIKFHSYNGFFNIRTNWKS
jgi:N-acetylglucosaminyl-diphospho-decaprenol L-rhamnosyltransferase